MLHKSLASLPPRCPTDCAKRSDGSKFRFSQECTNGLRKTPAAEYLAQVAERLLFDLARAEEDVRRMNSGVQHIVADCRRGLQQLSLAAELSGILEKQNRRHRDSDHGGSKKRPCHKRPKSSHRYCRDVTKTAAGGCYGDVAI